MADYRCAAPEIIAAVGGTDNVASVTHCMTRLRFNLKDESLANDETLEKIERVISVVHGNDQETCDRVAEMMMERAHCRGIIKSWVGCAIGAHTGPGIVAVVFSNASDEKYAQYLK